MHIGSHVVSTWASKTVPMVLPVKVQVASIQLLQHFSSEAEEHWRLPGIIVIASVHAYGVEIQGSLLYQGSFRSHWLMGPRSLLYQGSCRGEWLLGPRGLLYQGSFCGRRDVVIATTTQCICVLVCGAFCLNPVPAIYRLVCFKLVFR